MSASWDVLASRNSVKFDEGVRHSVYARDGYKCVYCSHHDKTGSGANLSLDHLTSLEAGGESQHRRGDGDKRTNLATACGPCNSMKQDKSPRDFNAYLKSQGKPPADFTKIRAQAGKKIDLKAGDRGAKIARAYRGAASYLDFSKINIDSGKTEGPGVQHDPDNGQFTSRRAPFRELAVVGEALALDPGGSGLLAAAARGKQPSPQAFGCWYDIPGPLRFDPEAIDRGIAVLRLAGPIEKYAVGMWHSYEALAREVECALACDATQKIVLKIDSPGGVAAGMNATHREIRRLRKAYGKPIYTYAIMACSAAYHVGSAADEVWLSEEDAVGSVGVILCTVDESKRLEKEGVAIRYVVTGERKADLHPGQPVTDDVLDVAQKRVDYLGSLFFKAVGKARAGAGLDARGVEKLQAAVFHGPQAVAVGLADGVASWRKFLDLVASVDVTARMMPENKRR